MTEAEAKVKLCTVSKPGFFTTIQDLGRFGFQRYGVPVSGAMDSYAFAAANLLVGNNPNDACLEMTLIGPDIRFLSDTQIAVAGADFSFTINEERAPCWQTLQVRRGDVFSAGSSQAGCRGYLAVRGGIGTPAVLGSRSTYVRGGFGGVEGRPLKTGDVLNAQRSAPALERDYSMPEELIPRYAGELTVDVVLGPQTSYFTDPGIEAFLSNVYNVTTEADRMGYRLKGAAVKLKNRADMVSDATVVGAVQVPTDGKPIILMQDAQTTGGYPKIAVVTTPDVSRLGQAKPKDKVRFSKVSPSEAREKLIEYRRTLGLLRSRLNKSEFLS